MGPGLVQPMPEEEGRAPLPEAPAPPPAGPPEEPRESNFSCSLRREGRFKGGGTESFVPALCELRGLERTTIPARPPPRLAEAPKDPWLWC